MVDTATLEREEDHSPELRRVMGPELLLLFIVGDILGTGVYALTGQVAGEVGGAAWAPFLVAFVVATITAFSYLELVTKYPQAAGAALYTHKAFGLHFLTFLVAFTVMCSGITSASTASSSSPRTRGRSSSGLEHHGGHLLWHWASCCWSPDQPARRRREREGQRRAHPGRARWSAARDRDRLLRLRQATPTSVEVIVVRHGRGQERLPRGHGRHVARVLRDGRLRGLGQHGRGDQGPAPDLPKVMLSGLAITGHHLRARVDHRGRLVPVGTLSDPTLDPPLIEVVSPAPPTSRSTTSIRSSRCSPSPTRRSSTC